MGDMQQPNQSLLAVQSEKGSVYRCAPMAVWLPALLSICPCLSSRVNHNNHSQQQLTASKKGGKRLKKGLTNSR